MKQTLGSTIKKYSKEITSLKDSGKATEFSYRTPFQNLIDQYARAKGLFLKTIQEQKREHFGAPDFAILAHDAIPHGYIETKDIVINLSDILTGRLKADKERLDKYLEAVPNLVLTNYEDFCLFRDGKKIATASLSQPQELEELLETFFLYEYPPATRPKELATHLAKRCKALKEVVLETLKLEEGAKVEKALSPYYEALKKYLLPSLDKEHFADAYSQTITYGLFLARLHTSGTTFTRRSAREGIPKSIPLLRKIFDHITGELPPEMDWIINELVGVLSKAALEDILKEFKFGDPEHDPFVHFYEDFLAVYNPKERQRRGVFYTPEPVVSFITRSIDRLLRSHFRREGLEDKGVIVLDPAAGTGTFLAYCIELINENLKKKGLQGAFSEVVKEHINNNLYGLEVMVSPYAICHLKLSRVLEDLGYRLGPRERLKVYLSNTLEFKPVEILNFPFIKELTEESHEANEVKGKRPVLVVLGNPPYSVSSDNKSEFIMNRLEDYKKDVKGERNIQPLDDDYIKFLRFAQWKIAEQNGEGIVGMITNNSYLSGLIHRGMRRHLLETFDEIYILNLHGSSLIGETAPDGSKDENVFDIRVGTAIVLLVKRRDRSSDLSKAVEKNVAQDFSPASKADLKVCLTKDNAKIFYRDLYGPRSTKYQFLKTKDVEKVEWQSLLPRSPYFFFVPKDFALQEEYAQFWSLSNIFIKFDSGIKTHRDHLLVGFTKREIKERIQNFINGNLKVKDTKYWQAEKTIKKIKDSKIESLICSYDYRPFDMRSLYYRPDTIERGDSRQVFMKHFILRENLGLISIRQVALNRPYTHVFLTKTLIDNRVFLSAASIASAFPLYRYTEFHGKLKKEPNLSPEFLKEVKNRYGEVEPEEILYYIYAVLHSPVYRERYKEFLKIDFPRIPLLDKKTFARALKVGERLVNLHLLQGIKPPYQARYPVGGDHKVERVKYDEANQRVYINDTQYFDRIPRELWEFHVGGYQVLEKWLKDRKGRSLSGEEIETYARIATALKETMKIMSSPPVSDLDLGVANPLQGRG